MSRLKTFLVMGMINVFALLVLGLVFENLLMVVFGAVCTVVILSGLFAGGKKKPKALPSTLETPDQLADDLADLLGIYTDRRCKDLGEDRHYQGDIWHGECDCRVFWVPRLTNRMRQAVMNEYYSAQMAVAPWIRS